MSRVYMNLANGIHAMSQTTTPSGADVDPLDAVRNLCNVAWAKTDHPLVCKSADIAIAAVKDLIARNAELEAQVNALVSINDLQSATNASLCDEFAKLHGLAAKFASERDALAAENKALRRAFPKPRNRCCMNCAEHGSCNPDGLNGCAYDDAGEDYDRGWNDCLDEALARTPAKGNDSCDSAT